jgi:hypothetical protein
MLGEDDESSQIWKVASPGLWSMAALATRLACRFFKAEQTSTDLPQHTSRIKNIAGMEKSVAICTDLFPTCLLPNIQESCMSVA